MAKIIIITGPSGAGKTTVAKQFLSEAEGEWAYISQDSLRQLVVAGYASADDYEHTWSDAVKRQWAASIPICVDIARRYQEAGISSIIDCYAPKKEFVLWQKALVGLKYTLVVLRPDAETVLARNAGRDNRSKLKDKKVSQNHNMFIDWEPKDALVLDTTSDSANDVVQKIQSIL